MQRYKLWLNKSQQIYEIAPDPEGEYVKYEDVPKPKKFNIVDILEVSKNTWTITKNGKRVGQTFHSNKSEDVANKLSNAVWMLNFINDYNKNEEE